MPGRRPRVLIVEDEAGVREAYAMLLELEGFEVVTATDGVDALEQLARDRFDVVLTDLMMPRLDGAALVARLAGNPDETPPVIMLTAAPHGAPPGPSVRVLTKPVDAEELVEAIRSVLPGAGPQG